MGQSAKSENGISIKVVGVSWLECLNVARMTQGLPPVNTVSDRWIQKLVRSKHSPLRLRMYYIKFTAPYWVAMHLRTHHVGISATIMQSSRTDITNQERDPNKLIECVMMLNAEALLNISAARTCVKASKETRQLWIDVIDVLQIVDPLLADACIPSCHDCKEFNPCGQ